MIDRNAKIVTNAAVAVTAKKAAQVVRDAGREAMVAQVAITVADRTSDTMEASVDNAETNYWPKLILSVVPNN